MVINVVSAPAKRQSPASYANPLLFLLSLFPPRASSASNDVPPPPLTPTPVAAATSDEDDSALPTLLPPPRPGSAMSTASMASSSPTQTRPRVKPLIDIAVVTRETGRDLVRRLEHRSAIGRPSTRRSSHSTIRSRQRHAFASTTRPRLDA
ncbi:hypothetical protein R3P38DRAFT_1655374 [Favolaschia claudopus]|uniref:Uncharacterized protein n=1 Tax=Favolaschia claudopus TaxID=2862362 RepID=A0AAW0AE39_9AGAR